jgi:hypothetical protein
MTRIILKVAILAVAFLPPIAASATPLGFAARHAHAMGVSGASAAPGDSRLGLAPAEASPFVIYPDMNGWGLGSEDCNKGCANSNN